MPLGRSLHIGLNHIDFAHYGQDPVLSGCELDARAMAELATTRGFAAASLLTADATVDAITGAIGSAAEHLRSGDMFLVTYAGHGAQVPDLNGDEGRDGRDETWVLYDRMLVDDELADLWRRFVGGVRIVVVSDSCHSGTVTRDIDLPPPGIFRNLPREIERATYAAHRATYDDIQARYPTGDAVAIDATVLLLSACRDDQLARDGHVHGLYTERLLAVWGNGAFAGPYAAFQAEIARGMPTKQTPVWSIVGAANPIFEAQVPFTI